MNRALQFNLTYLLCTNMMGSDSQGSLAPGVGRQTRSLVCYRSWHGLAAPTGSSEGTETAMASPASPLGSGVQVLQPQCREASTDLVVCPTAHIPEHEFWRAPSYCTVKRSPILCTLEMAKVAFSLASGRRHMSKEVCVVADFPFSVIYLIRPYRTWWSLDSWLLHGVETEANACFKGCLCDSGCVKGVCSGTSCLLFILTSAQCRC